MNSSRSDSLMTTVLIFDKNGRRRTLGQHEVESASPSLPCLKIVLQQLNAKWFDDELFSNGQNLTSVPMGNVQKVEKVANSDRENQKITLEFLTSLTKVFNSTTNKLPPPPCLGIWDLFRLWKYDLDDWFWINYPMLGSADLEMEVLNEPRLLHRTHLLYLKRYGSAFSMLPSVMRMCSPAEEHLLGAKPRFE